MRHLKAFHHVAVICSDYARSRHFYTVILGLDIIHETYRHERQSWKLDLKLGEHGQIELFSFPEPPARVSHPEACGLRHLAFTVEDMDATIAYLKEHGVEVEPVRIDAHTQQRYTFFADPDGLPLELYET
jgi:glyoxylase I family protein